MKRFFQNNGGLLLVAAALLAAVLAIGAQILGFDPLTSALEVLATPFRAASAAVANWTQAQYDRNFRYEDLAADNEALRRRVAQLEQDAIAGQDAQRENERLRDLLGLREERPELQYRDAAVVRGASSNWTADFTIDQGTAGGVEVDDCVIDQYGHLIGVVTEAGPNSSRVTTILDPTLELGGRVARTDEDAILEGDFTLMQEGLLRVRAGQAGHRRPGNHLRAGGRVPAGAGGGDGALPPCGGGRREPVRPGGAGGGYRRDAVCVCHSRLRRVRTNIHSRNHRMAGGCSRQARQIFTGTMAFIPRKFNAAWRERIRPDGELGL